MNTCSHCMLQFLTLLSLKFNWQKFWKGGGGSWSIWEGNLPPCPVDRTLRDQSYDQYCGCEYMLYIKKKMIQKLPVVRICSDKHLALAAIGFVTLTQ